MPVLDRFRLDDKVAMVTGAGRGIGKAMAVALAEAGADVVVLARTKDQIEQTAEEIRKLGRRALPLELDLTKGDQIQVSVEKTIDTFGHIHILVNNAGMALVKPLIPIPGFDEGIGYKDLLLVLETNFIGPFFLTQAVGKHFMKQGHGKVINITSVDAERSGTHKTTYATSKAAILQFTKALAHEWGRYNIQVNAISPGAFHTEMSKKVYEDDQLLKQMHARIPMRRSGRLEELGPPVVFLASEASSYITGIVLYVDGGYMVL
jgi:NAD(P)-dependent dehydrogenase (short-subunit alcohol dehydrogenase family)